MTEGFEIIFMILAYAIIGVSSITTIDDSIYDYKSRTVQSHKMKTFLHDNNKRLIFFGVVLWPLFYCFKLGFLIGTSIYKILINDKYEDRIASWLI
jgi:hypothetical protein